MNQPQTQEPNVYMALLNPDGPDAQALRQAAGKPDKAPAPMPTLEPEIRKAWLTLQARATLAGFVAVLTETDDGRPQMIVSRWSMTKAFDGLADLEAWLDRVAGKAKTGEAS